MNWAWFIPFRLLALGVLALMAISCKKGDSCFTSPNATSVQTYTINNFDDLYLNGRLDVVLIQDSTNTIEIEYADNLQKSVIITEEINQLHITESIPCPGLGKQTPFPKVYVHFSNLNFIDFKIAGNLSTENLLKLDSLFIDVIDVNGNIQLVINTRKLILKNHTASVDFTFSGKADQIDFYHNGYGTIDASMLDTRLAVISSNSTGQTHLNVSEIMYYNINDWGDIYVSGNPQIVNWGHTGTGKLIID